MVKQKTYTLHSMSTKQPVRVARKPVATRISVDAYEKLLRRVERERARAKGGATPNVGTVLRLIIEEHV